MNELDWDSNESASEKNTGKENCKLEKEIP